MARFACLIALFAALRSAACAASPTSAPIEPATAISIDLFLVFVCLTLGIGVWASRRTRSAIDFYVAGGGITALQNGLAMTGAYISAASFLGISGLVYLRGFGGLIYSIGSVVGWPIFAVLLAEPLCNLGRFTVADAVSFRLSQTPIRVLCACATLATVIFYLISQMVGGGALIGLLFGLDYPASVAIVGALAIFYIALGGMLATTWIQILKACLLLVAMSALAFMIMMAFNFNLAALFASSVAVHSLHSSLMSPDQLLTDPVSTISLALALMFGVAGLPHVLMRIFSVANARIARQSVLYATGFIGYFYVLTFVTGFGAIALLPSGSDLTAGPAMTPTSNERMSNVIAIQLSYVVGGGFFLSFFAAAAFATILAVVSGLTLAGAASISHDLYAAIIAKGKSLERDEIAVSRAATVALGGIAVALGIAFREQNVAYMIGLAFSIAASCNFPILFMSIMWRGATTRGIVIGGSLGLVSSLAGVILSPAVWIGVLGQRSAPFPYDNPTLFSMPLAFAGIWLFSKLDRSERAKKDRAGFDAQFVRAQTGIGASGPVAF
jgi:cation/acetate symporter